MKRNITWDSFLPDIKLHMNLEGNNNSVFRNTTEYQQTDFSY